MNAGGGSGRFVEIAKLGKTYDDPLLEDYLGGVAAKLVPQEAQQAGAPTPRIAVFRDPTLNGFAMPNGRIYMDRSTTKSGPCICRTSARHPSRRHVARTLAFSLCCFI